MKEREPPYLLSLDLGTTMVKAALFSLSGAVIQMTAREQTLSFPQPGRVEQSPSDTWDLIAEVVRELSVDSQEIRAIAISNQRGTVIPLTKTGQPLSDLIVWMDKRGVPYVDWLLENVGLETYYNTSGHPIVSYTGISKLIWLQREEPDIWKQAEVIAPPQTLFLTWLGCKDLVCDFSTGTFLFPFDIDQKRWSERLADQLGFSTTKLPSLVSAIDSVGHLSQEAADHLGLQAGVPLVAGGGDGQCAGVGSGVVEPGRVMINIGTAAGVQTYLSSPLRDPNLTLNCAAHVVPEAWEMEGHTQASGTVFRWFRDEFGVLETTLQSRTSYDAYDLLIEEVRQAPPGANGLVCIPTFNGSSAPQVDLNARGCFVGLTLSHKRSHIIRALLEGISLELRWMLDAIVDIGSTAAEVRLVGGGARNRYWNQIHADVLNQPVSTLRTTDAALVGAAMCAAVAIGAYSDFQEAAEHFVQVEETIEPNLLNQEVYEAAYKNYREAFTLLSEGGVFDHLDQQASLYMEEGSDE